VIAPTADVYQRARVAASARIWALAQVREDAVVGENCIIGRGAYIDAGVIVGDNCKIQNHALVYAPAVLEEGVFVGPAVVFTNDTFPRAVKPDLTLKDAHDWEAIGVTVRRGASVGARSVVLGGVEIGEWALIAAGSVVTKDVPAHGLMVGSPARRVGWVGASGVPLLADGDHLADPSDGTRYREEDGRLTRT